MRSGTSATPSQKNGVVVRQVVGHGRLVGEHACRQLTELYRALRLYVNCFQPSMKLVTKQVDERKIYRSYDAAKTPLQRLLFSGMLFASRQQELSAVAKALDPIRLFQQVEQLQQAIFRYAVNGSAPGQQTSVLSLLKFDLQGHTLTPCLLEGMGHDERSVSALNNQNPQERVHVLDWRRTSKDPFAGQWEQILFWVQANPTRSGRYLSRTPVILFVRGKGGKVRRIPIGSTCLSHLRSYLVQAYPGKKNALARRKKGDDPLFVSERGHGLTKSSLTSLMSRLRTRAGSSETVMTPQNLRQSFALRYLQAGGEPQGLQALMGYEGMAPIRHYLRWHTQWLHDQMQKGAEEV